MIVLKIVLIFLSSLIFKLVFTQFKGYQNWLRLIWFNPRRVRENARGITAAARSLCIIDCRLFERLIVSEFRSKRPDV